MIRTTLRTVVKGAFRQRGIMIQYPRLLRVGIAAVLAAFTLSKAPLAGAESSAILIYGPEDAGMTEQQQAMLALAASIGEGELPASSIHILDLPFPSADPVWIAGDARVVPCSDPARENEDLAALLSAGVDAIDALDYEEGKRTLDQAITALPCATQQVERVVLLELYYFRGIAAFHLGDRDGARQSFQYALAIDREKTWDTNYPPEPQQVFLLAKEDAIGLDRVDIGHDVADADVSSFAFDGTPLDASDVGVQQVIPGMHLVQYKVGDTPYSRLVEVRKEGPAALVTRAGLTAAVMNGPDSGGSLPAARASLRALVQGRNLQRAYVVVLGSEGSAEIFQYDETYTTLKRTAPITQEATAQVGTGASAGDKTNSGADYSPGGVTLGVGGFAFAHGNPYASFDLRGHVKLFRGLEVELGGGANIKRFMYEDAPWLATMPLLRTGLRYRFGHKAFRPYAGGALLLSFWKTLGNGDDEDALIRVSPGGVVYGGFDVHITPVVYANLDIDVGFSHRVWVGLQGGVGFRL